LGISGIIIYGLAVLLGQYSMETAAELTAGILRSDDPGIQVSAEYEPIKIINEIVDMAP
jgi:hypothetical protein